MSTAQLDLSESSLNVLVELQFQTETDSVSFWNREMKSLGTRGELKFVWKETLLVFTGLG